MDTDKQTFSRIAVSAEEDDDFVLQAGAVPFETEGDPSADHGGSVGDVRADGETGWPAPRESRPPCGEAAPVETGSSGTSLEDLEGFKMGGLQKAIVAVAVLSVIGFAIYYMFFR